MKFKLNIFSYEILILVGLVMSVGTLLKLLGFYDISSDWFWFIGGVGLVVEGTISLLKQKTFENKYKIIKMEEKNEGKS